MIRYAIPALAIAAAFMVTAATPYQSGEDMQAGKLAKALDGLTPGAPVSCLPRDRVTQVKGYNNTLLYIQGKNRVWVNETNGGCEGVGKRDDIMVTRSMGSAYCTGDTVETRSRSGGMFTGVCSLGKFTPYSKQ